MINKGGGGINLPPPSFNNTRNPMNNNFVENARMQIEARYENEDGSITVKYIEVSEEAAEYFRKINVYIGWLQDEILKKEVEPMSIEFSANSPLILN